MGLSRKERMALLPAGERLKILKSLSDDVLEEMLRDEWWFTARPEQIPPSGKEFIYLFMAGRGAGKSRSGSEWIVDKVLKHPKDRQGVPTEWLVVADTLADARTINAEGPSGILNVLNRRKVDHRYKQSPRPMVLFPDGAKIYMEGADDPDTGRGYNAAGALCDEICVAEGESVLTVSGPLPVEQVRPGILVLTRSGWRPVVSSGLTAVGADVVKVTTVSGASIRLTPDHLVWSQRGWVRAEDLTHRDSVAECQPQMNRFGQTLPPTVSGLNRPGTTTRGPATTTTAKASYFTVASGNLSTDRSLMDLRSITSTGSDTTPGWRTWSVSLGQNTDGSPPPSEMILPGLTASVSAPLKGSPSIGRRGKLNPSSATFAGKRFTAPACAPNDAQGSADVSLVYGSLVKVKSVEPSGKSRVYDLTVAGSDPEFYAGTPGILVHNCKWVRPYETWYEGLMPSLRADLVDDHPRAFVTTTPKPINLLLEWVTREDGSVHVITGSTFDNASNLSAPVLMELKRRYDGTSLGEQELYGKLLELAGGGLFKRMDIVRNRVRTIPDDVELVSTVVGVDPALTGEDDLTGVVVVARDSKNVMWVLSDHSIQAAGREACLHVWRVAADFGADIVVYEENLGKRYLAETLADTYRESVELDLFPKHTTPPMRAVHAKHGKKTRAEPVALRCEQGRLRMVGDFPKLEDEMVLFDPQSSRDSPDRMDAMVHGCLHLMAGEKRRMSISGESAYDFRITQDLYNLDRLL